MSDRGRRFFLHPGSHMEYVSSVIRTDEWPSRSATTLRADRPDAPARGWRPRYPPSLRDASWLLLVPLGIVAVGGYFWVVLDDPLASLDARGQGWNRHLVLPVVGMVQGLADGVWGLHRVRTGFNPLTDQHTRVALGDVGFLAFAVVATAGALRRLPLAYSAYALAGLGVALSSVPAVGRERLQSFSRFLLVLFPLFFWLALWTRTPRRWWLTMTASVALLAFYTGLFATWRWVA